MQSGIGRQEHVNALVLKPRHALEDEREIDPIFIGRGRRADGEGECADGSGFDRRLTCGGRSVGAQPADGEPEVGEFSGVAFDAEVDLLTSRRRRVPTTTPGRLGAAGTL